MEDILGAVAFFALIALQFAAVIAVHRMRLDQEAAARDGKSSETAADPRTRHFLQST